jgi:hypothetical protein
MYCHRIFLGKMCNTKINVSHDRLCGLRFDFWTSRAWRSAKLKQEVCILVWQWRSSNWNALVVPTILYQAITFQSGMSFRRKNFEADVSRELQLITNTNTQDV